jgi:hypothetical protein
MVIVNIDRTKRFNRNVNVYRGVEHSPWRPDRERRFVREQRAREIPQYRPVVRPLAPVPARRPGGKIVAPPKSDPGRERKGVIEKDKVEKREQLDRKIEPRSRNVEVKPPAQVKPQPERKGVIERGKVEKQEQLDSKIEPRNRNVEVKSPGQVKPPVQVKPQPERKDVIERDKGEKRERLDDTRNAPREGRGESDRGNERGSGGGREGRR